MGKKTTNTRLRKATTASRDRYPIRRSTYPKMLSGMVSLLEQARLTAVRQVNAAMTAAYWDVGRRIVEFEQGGSARAGYGEEVIDRLSIDLSGRFGRGFSRSNLQVMRSFYLAFRTAGIGPKTSRKPAERKSQTVSGEFDPVRMAALTKAFPLSWSHYALLSQRARDAYELRFYHAESVAGAWSVRQLERQMDGQFYQRTALSRDKLSMLRNGRKAKTTDLMSIEQQVRDPLLLSFLNLKDEYSESDMENALVEHMERFLLELGIGFTFWARQKRVRIGGEYFKADLVLYHRVLRCLVVIDLKVRAYRHKDSSQMNTYLNYAREHWMLPEENPPIGLILCSSKNDALVKYSTGGMANNMLVREYLLKLPAQGMLEKKLKQFRRELARLEPGTA